VFMKTKDKDGMNRRKSFNFVFDHVDPHGNDYVISGNQEAHFSFD